MQAAVIIRRVIPTEASQLLELSKTTFFDAFAHLNNAADMEAYASKAFTLPKIEKELNNPHSFFYFALLDDQITGYLKVNFNSAQTELQDPNALEVERIYLLQTHQCKQIGSQLLKFAIDMARQKSMHYVWLGVWEHNYKAIKFYQNNGFKIFSSHPFVLGTDKQTDVLLKKKL